MKIATKIFVSIEQAEYVSAAAKAAGINRSKYLDYAIDHALRLERVRPGAISTCHAPPPMSRASLHVTIDAAKVKELCTVCAPLSVERSLRRVVYALCDGLLHQLDAEIAAQPIAERTRNLKKSKGAHEALALTAVRAWSIAQDDAALLAALRAIYSPQRGPDPQERVALRSAAKTIHSAATLRRTLKAK